jgi:ABC-type nitrate/sulfonate/bicarbonate transport system permease component
VLLSSDQDQADMQSATAIIIVILFIGILVHTLFSMADRSVRRRWGLTGNA